MRDGSLSQPGELMTELRARLAGFPLVDLGHYPTPVDALPRLGASLGLDLWVKRDDCTGLGLGGNKIRQLEFYLGQARDQAADTVVITGAVQSNFTRSTAAAAAKLGMACHIQLEERVADVTDLYRSGGNVLVEKLMGATLYSYPRGEDEAGADRALGAIATELRQQGRTPYVIHLAANHPPFGALGFVAAACELVGQYRGNVPFDEIVIASGSALTHCGVLLGLRGLGCDVPVRGICVRRDSGAQARRVRQRLQDLADLLDMANPVAEDDILLFDGVLEPGYGRMSVPVQHAISETASREGLVLDPVYTGKSMAGLMALAGAGDLNGQRILFWHTGGQPALFAYGDSVLG